MTKKPKTEAMTAHDLMAKLNADPDFVARQRQRDLELERREADRLRAEAPIIADLRAAGHPVRSVWDLVNTSAPYPAALPVLLRHLCHAYPEEVLEGVARALAVPATKDLGWDTLVGRYKSEPSERVKDGIAVAIAACAQDDVIDDVVSLVLDRSNGASRVFVMKFLARSRDSRARAALLTLQSDPELAQEIAAKQR